MRRIIPLVVLLIVSADISAQTPASRFELGKKLRRFEVALEATPAGAKRDKALAGLRTLTITFLSGQIAQSGKLLDEALLTLTRDDAGDADRWAVALSVNPKTHLLDATARELPVQMAAFYSAGDVPARASVALTLIDPASGKPVATTNQAVEKLPAEVVLPLGEAKAGDYLLRAEVVVADKTLATVEQAVSRVADLERRMKALTAASEKLRAKERSTDRESLLLLVRDLEALAAGKPLETSLAGDRLLKEAEEGVAAVLEGRPCYGRKQPGDFHLVLATKGGTTRVRLQAPKQAAEGKPLPLVVALHGAGGSENMFFDGYGNGLVRKLAAERGWLVVAPVTTFAGGFNAGMLDEIDKLYPVDRDKVFILGHSMGAAATMSAISATPKLYRAAAALGGGGGIKAGDDLKKVPVFIAVGKDDFALNAARSLHQNLQKAGVARVEMKEYPGVEHLTVVQLGLRDVFAFFDKSLEK